MEFYSSSITYPECVDKNHGHRLPARVSQWGADNSGQGKSSTNPVTAESIKPLVHNFVYKPDGSLEPNQPGLTLYDPDSFGTSGNVGNWGAQRSAAPPGLASNNGLPEEVVVTGNRFQSILSDPTAVRDEDLAWAQDRAHQERMDWFWKEGAAIAAIQIGATAANGGDFIRNGYGDTCDASWSALNKPFVKVGQEISRRRNNGTWSLD